MNSLIKPYILDSLVNLMATEEDAADWYQRVPRLPAIALNAHQQSDLMLLLTGGYTPLTGYMGQADYVSVLEQMRLSNGDAWMYPLTLPVPIRLAQTLNLGQGVALKGANDEAFAILTVTEIYRAQPALEAQALGAALTFGHEVDWYVAGTVVGINTQCHYDFIDAYRYPAQLRAHFTARGWGNVLAFQTAQPVHRGALAFMLRAAAQNQAGLLMQPMTGGNQSTQSAYYPTIRSYHALLARLSPLTTIMSLSPNYPRRGGVREILHRAIISRNDGCSHLIVGGEAYASGANRRGRDVLEGDAFHQVEPHIQEIGVKLIPYPRMVYVEDKAQHLPLEEAPKDAYKLVLTADEVKRRLQADLPIPDWYAFPEVLQEMRIAYPPRIASGFAVLMSGIAGVGKTSLALALSEVLGAAGARKVTVLDNQTLNRYPGLVNNLDIIALLVSALVRQGGIVICALDIAMLATRRSIRNATQLEGGYFEIALTAPASVCAGRLARKGRSIVEASDYEVSEQIELLIDTSIMDVAQALQRIVLKLEQDGYV
jgi:sulfate adenylyltransferase